MHFRPFERIPKEFQFAVHETAGIESTEIRRLATQQTVPAVRKRRGNGYKGKEFRRNAPSFSYPSLQATRRNKIEAMAPSPLTAQDDAGKGTSTVSTYVGDLNYQHQTLSKSSAEKLHRQMALSRASECVLWSQPAMSFYQALRACQQNLKVAPSDLAIGLYEGSASVRTFLTANVTTPYTVSFFDLSQTGPVVFEIPEGGIYGVANNAWQQPTKEINSGLAEKVLMVGPGQSVPQGFDGEVVQTSTFVNLLFYRVLGVGPEAEKLKRAVKAYKLADAQKSPQTMFIPFTPGPNDPIALNSIPADFGFWELLNEMIQKEPMADRDRFFYAWLRDLGIKKGEPFLPTDEQKQILTEGLKVGLAMAQACSFDSVFPAAVYQSKDSGWEWVLGGLDPAQDLDTHTMYNERTAYTYEAVSISKSMISQIEGRGSGYLGAYYDAEGNAFMGEFSYTLHLEPDVPAVNFWSVTVYEIATRVVIKNETGKADISSRSEGLQTNPDGSVDLFFGPTPPAAAAAAGVANWVQTNPGQSWFAYFRAYGPKKAFFEATYKMNKITRIK
uniref:DUF1254 domain-containing protein n=1 Tax=Chromera velia CCMP2878 TaxID=1169474 RepID=A0A0G4HIV9_9ALVE|eukprot:Cvel_27948.t1-p1 / transcript=Cvel_27948.t1 / gene=Cvel_27948 / organism=Chromera_velia_CCMP2878 / gene_product=hypothetical protein / transcript_product=hypothetical protein / location=Cvel_scaffold3566:12542-14880(-) / protein_length=556 / sequence_SO=supercontig / SO=protein_coding / is_pseudo=false